MNEDTTVILIPPCKFIHGMMLLWNVFAVNQSVWLSGDKIGLAALFPRFFGHSSPEIRTTVLCICCECAVVTCSQIQTNFIHCLILGHIAGATGSWGSKVVFQSRSAPNDSTAFKLWKLKAVGHFIMWLNFNFICLKMNWLILVNLLVYKGI